MPLIIHSPFSGKPVKVRDEDVGRAVRDENRRIFYVIQRPDGEGYYGSPTRHGGEKELARYDELVAAGGVEEEAATTAEPSAAGDAPAGGVPASPAGRPAPLGATNVGTAATPHDATGTRRRVSPVRLIILLLIAATLVASGVWLFMYGPLAGS